MTSPFLGTVLRNLWRLTTAPRIWSQSSSALATVIGSGDASWGKLDASNTSERADLVMRSQADAPSTSQRCYAASASNDAQSLLRWSVGAFALPHPEKVARGGEDAYFIANHHRAVGVADGVGGWAQHGIDSGIYSRQLMHLAKVEAERVSTSGSDDASQEGGEITLSAKSIFTTAHGLTDATGSATCCILVLNGSTLQASNVGDSGFVLVRGDCIAMRSTSQQHGFNFPYQVGSHDSNSDPPSTAQVYDVPLQAGDVVLLATDGLWDNCFDDQLLEFFSYARKKKLDPSQSAKALAHYAQHCAADSKSPSPFTHKASEHGLHFPGGKMDDITVIVVHVYSAAARL